MTKQVITFDTASRLIAETVGLVLKKLAPDHSVSGVAVFYIDNSYLVDLNFTGPENTDTWSLSFQVPSDTDKKRSMPNKANPCAKRVRPEEAYEVWQSIDGSWTYFVLKKYQSPEKEAKNAFTRWYCMVQSPASPRGEYADVYVSSVKQGTRQIDNPMHRVICVKGASITTLENIGLSKYPVTDLVLKDARLRQYLKISVPPKDFAKVKRTLEEQMVAIVCIDAPDFLFSCLTEVLTSETDQ